MVTRYAKCVIATCVSLVLAAFPVRAQEVSPPEPLAPSVDELVARALQRSPTLDSLKTRYFAALRAVRPAGALEDPMLEVGYRGEGRPWDPMRQGSMAEVVLTQVIPYPGKRRSRRDVAQASAQVVEAEAREWQQRLIAQVRTLYGHIHALDREDVILRSSSDLLDLLEATSAARYASGQADQEALVKVQVERLRVRERQAEIQTEREELVASLLGLLDEPSTFTLGRVASLPTVSLPIGDLERTGADALAGLEEAAIANCCIVAVARARVEAAQQRLYAARLEARPNFLVGLGAGSTLTPEPVLSVRFGVEIPFWAGEKQKPLVQEALLGVRAAEADLREKEALVRSEVRSLLARFRRSEELLRVYREGIVPLTSLALEAALASYRAGTGNFSTVAEDFRGLLQAQITLARLESDRFVAWAGLQELLTPIPPIEEVAP